MSLLCEHGDRCKCGPHNRAGCLWSYPARVPDQDPRELVSRLRLEAGAGEPMTTCEKLMVAAAQCIEKLLAQSAERPRP